MRIIISNKIKSFLCVAMSIFLLVACAPTTGVTQSSINTQSTNVNQTLQTNSTLMATAGTSAAPAHAKGIIGERVLADHGVTLTVLGIQTVKQINDFVKAENGMVFLEVQVYIENLNSTESISYSASYFNLRDSEGQEFDTTVNSFSPDLLSGEIEPGGFIRGTISFTVPETSSNFVLSYKSDYLFNNSVSIQIDLSKTANSPIVDPAAKSITAPCIVGNKCEKYGIAVKVISVNEPKSVKNLYTPSSGYKYIDVELQIENPGKFDEISYNPLDFKLKDSKGFVYLMANHSEDPSLQNGKLSKGQKINGHITFEVNNNSSGFALYYDSIIILGGMAPLVIALAQ